MEEEEVIRILQMPPTRKPKGPEIHPGVVMRDTMSEVGADDLWIIPEEGFSLVVVAVPVIQMMVQV